MMEHQITHSNRNDIPSFMAGMVTERTRIARDLHDTLLQSLAGLALQIGGLSKAAISESDKRKLQTLRTDAEECLREAREAVWNIRRVESESLDLASELKASGERLSAETASRIDFSMEGKHQRIPTELGEHLLRIGTEAMANAAHHARAGKIQVRLTYADDSIRLRIRDDGNGFKLHDPSSNPGHFGLRTMRERAEQIRASITIASELTRGTSVQVTVPNPAEKS